MSKKPFIAPSPCCEGHVVKVTHRKSKLAERPRNSVCEKCKQAYRCTVSGNKAVFLS